MKLLFPNGEHPQVLLNDGLTRIGSAPDCQVVVPGLSPRHAEIRLAGDAATLRRAADQHEVTINGAPVTADAPIRPGDLLTFGPVQARAVAVERASAVAPPKRPEAVDDSGATRLRMAVPKFVLRGVSGAAFGKTFPVGREVLVGRQQDCDIPVPAEEVSRHHARIKPTPDGLLVEDLGSANGTYINGKRIQQGLLKAGDELRLDTIRFLLIAPGTEMPRTAPAPAAQPAPARAGMGAGLIMVLVVVALLLAGGGWYLMR